MSKITPRLFSIALCLSLVSCDTATPENYFDRAVLNCNLMHGFAGSGLRRELESPSVKLSETGNGETIPMKRKEVIGNAITSLEANFEKVKKLKETDDTRDILQASVALYEFVLPVYKTEYQQLARLYDEGAAREEIATDCSASARTEGRGTVLVGRFCRDAPIYLDPMARCIRLARGSEPIGKFFEVGAIFCFDGPGQ